MTAGDAIKRSLRQLGVLDAGVDPTADDYAAGLVALNGMISSWSAGRNAIHAPTTITHTLTASTANYTIGAAGTIVVARPNKILTAFVRADTTDYPIEVFSVNDYQRIGDKTTEGIPYRLYIEMGYPTATIYLYYTPNDAYVLHLKLWAPLSTYATVGTSLGLPLEYEDAIVFNLSLRLHPEYPGRPLPETIPVFADKTLKLVKALNAHPVPLANTQPFGTGFYLSNIYGDGRR